MWTTTTAAPALRAAGCVAADEEAGLLAEAARGDGERFEALVARRCTGEPLAWLTGTARFCGYSLLVHPGVYVPRVQTEPLALEAAARLPARGLAVDLCTGSGAVAVVLRRRRPEARVLATDIDPRATACAAANGVQVFAADSSPRRCPRASPGAPTWSRPWCLTCPPRELRLLARDVQASSHAKPWTAVARHRAARARRRGRRGAVAPGRPAPARAGRRPGRTAGAGADGAGLSDLQARRDEDGDLRALVCRR